MPILAADTTLQTRAGQLLITDRKIRFTAQSLGTLHVKSILLPKITSIELKSDANPAFLLIGAIVLISSYFLQVDHAFAVGIAVAVISVAAYFFTIKRAIVISSASAVISVTMPHFSNEEALQFIDQLEHRV